MRTLVGQLVESVEKASLVRGDLTLTRLGLSNCLEIGFAEVRPRSEMMQAKNKALEYMVACLIS